MLPQRSDFDLLTSSSMSAQGGFQFALVALQQAGNRSAHSINTRGTLEVDQVFEADSLPLRASHPAVKVNMEHVVSPLRCRIGWLGEGGAVNLL